MAIFNTTYNYNQPNMNLGQAMLYGMFGSLTGGMGGCMGMGGSIFSMMPGMGMMGMGGFGGCGMGYYSDSMVGAQIGNIFAGCLMAGLGQLIDGRGGNGSGESSATKISAKENEASKHLSTLGEDITLANFNPNKKASEYNVVKDLDDKVKIAQDAKTECESNITSQKTEVARLEGLIGTEPKSSDEKYKDKPELFTKEHKEWVSRQEAYEKAKNELENMQKSVKDDGKLGKALIDAKEAKESKEKEIQTAIDALKPLKVKYDELVAEQNSKSLNELLNKADGNSVSRMRKSDEGKAQTALYDFRKAQEKWNKGDHSDTVKNLLKSAYKNVKDNQNGISSKYESILDSIDSWITQEKLEEIKD